MPKVEQYVSELQTQMRNFGIRLAAVDVLAAAASSSTPARALSIAMADGLRTACAAMRKGMLIGGMSAVAVARVPCGRNRSGDVVCALYPARG